MDMFDAKIGDRVVVLSGSIVHHEPDGTLKLEMLGGEFEFEFSRGGEIANLITVVGSRKVHIALVNYDNYGGTSFLIERIPYEGRELNLRVCVHSLSANGTRLISFTAA